MKKKKPPGSSRGPPGAERKDARKTFELTSLHWGQTLLESYSSVSTARVLWVAEARASRAQNATAWDVSKPVLMGGCPSAAGKPPEHSTPQGESLSNVVQGQAWAIEFTEGLFSRCAAWPEHPGVSYMHAV